MLKIMESEKRNIQTKYKKKNNELEIACEHLDETSTGKLGINLKSETVTQSILYSEYEEEEKEEIEPAEEIYYVSNNTRPNGGRAPRGRRSFYNSYRGRNYNRNGRSTRNQKRFDNRSCYHCGLVGHVISACWKLYPDLKKKYFQKRAQTNKTRKPQKGDLLIINEEGKLEMFNDNIPEEASQYEVYCMEHEQNGEFKFEGIKSGDKAQDIRPTEPTETTTDTVTETDTRNATEAKPAEQQTQQEQLESFLCEYLYHLH